MKHKTQNELVGIFLKNKDVRENCQKTRDIIRYMNDDTFNKMIVDNISILNDMYDDDLHRLIYTHKYKLSLDTLILVYENVNTGNNIKNVINLIDSFNEYKINKMKNAIRSGGEIKIVMEEIERLNSIIMSIKDKITHY